MANTAARGARVAQVPIMRRESVGMIAAHRRKLRNFSAEDFCAALVSQLVIKNKSALYIGSPEVEAAFRQIVNELRSRAREARKNQRRELALSILRILEQIGPNPNTGAFDGFWAMLRKLQPGRVGIPNPMYPAIEFKVSRARAEAELRQLPPEWGDLVRETTQHLVNN